MRVKRVNLEDGTLYGVRFDCPGCNEPHVVTVPPSAHPWAFNGDYDRPTISPSIHVLPVRHDDDSTFRILRCHSFVTDGRIQFLGDCEHALAGQTVDLPEVSP